MTVRIATMSQRRSVVANRHHRALRAIVIPMDFPANVPQRVPSQPARPPVRQHVGAQLLVEANRRSVPVEHVPVHAAAAARDGQARQVAQQRLANPRPTCVRLDVEVLEEQARPPEKRREVVEEQREAHRGAVELRDHHFGGWMRAEQLLGQQRLGGHDLMLELLVRGQFADETEDDRHIGSGGGAQRERGHLDKDTGRQSPRRGADLDRSRAPSRRSSSVELVTIEGGHWCVIRS